ncbi:MAG TPA: glycosyltransferase family 39 protein [bacterium]|nr:glycosyltransferase family 39 protein [bacterium]
MMRKGWLPAILALALALRFAGLGHWSLWNDEVATVQEARALFSYGGAQRYPINYLLTAATFTLLGDNAFTARLLPALWGTATVAAVYLLGGYLAGRTTAVLAALVLALHPYHIFWSQNARHYALLVLLLTLFLYCVYRARREDRPLGVGWLLFLLAALTHTTAVLALPAILLLKWHRVRRLFPLLVAIIVVTVLACFLWEPLRTVTVDRLRAGRSWGGDAVHVLAAFVYYFNPALLVLAWYGWKQVPDCRSHKLALWVAIPVAALLLASFFGDVNTAYALFALPVVIILAAAGVAQSAWRGRLGILMLLALVPQLWWYYQSYGQRPRYREAARFIVNHQRQTGVARTTMTSLPRTMPHYLATPVLGISADARLLNGVYVLQDYDFNYLDPDGRVRGILQARGLQLASFRSVTPVRDYTLTLWYLPPKD